MDSNFKNVSCQLGGLTLNGNVLNGTASSLNLVTINDPSVIQQGPTGSTGPVGLTGPIGYIQIKIGNDSTTGPIGDFTKPFFIPIYQ